VAWTAPDVTPVDGPLTGPDRPMVVAYLDWQRTTLHAVCAGLTPGQLAARPLPSTNLSLLGIVRHLTKVERTWFRIRVAGEDIAPVFDPALGKDHDFDAIDPEQAPDALEHHRAECRAAADAVAAVPLDYAFELRGELMSLRMVYLHMIGEYARHNGHADLLREAIDGVTGR
jgi:uncharacterized damage-inducible protein DinB